MKLALKVCIFHGQKKLVMSIVYACTENLVSLIVLMYVCDRHMYIHTIEWSCHDKTAAPHCNDHSHY